MTAQIGADGQDFFGDPRPDLLTGVTALHPKRGGEWVDLTQLGFRSTQRLQISNYADGVAVATWPAELKPQALYLYDGGLGAALVAAATERGWIVKPSPHIAFRTSPPSRRLYMSPLMAPLDYVARWEDEDALRRVGGNYARGAVEQELWPWLKHQGFADDGDDAELLRFLDGFLGDWPANMRPGLRFRRDWTFAEADELGAALAETMRSEFDAVFAVAHEPALGPGETTASPGLAAPHRQVPAIELSRNRDPLRVHPALAERGLPEPTDTQSELAGGPGAAEGGGIFVSYRRQETSHLAGRLADRLADRFGEGQVFIDVDTIEPGVDFAEEISRAVASCKVLLAIIGPVWLTATDERGRLRLDDPDDIVRLEIEAALARNVRVIPILVEGAVMPGRHDLPESLSGLARRNAFPIRHETFRSDAERLISAIERIFAAAPSRLTSVPESGRSIGAQRAD